MEREENSKGQNGRCRRVINCRDKVGVEGIKVLVGRMQSKRDAWRVT
jgi:hypothetical protein